MKATQRLRCLWIGREIPIPANTGDRIYSLKLAESLAEQNVHVTFLGVSASNFSSENLSAPIHWQPVIGTIKPYWMAFFSSLPLVAAALGTRTLRENLKNCLSEHWDAVILDNYATAWALKQVVNARRFHPTTVLIHISHNFETGLSRQLVASFHGSFAKKLVLISNAWKIQYWEKRILAQCDVISTITEEDSVAVRAISGPKTDCLILTPGYSGPRATRSLINSQRRVVLVGSFRWIVKQENLRLLLEVADLIFYESGIVLDVVGQVSDELIEGFEGKLRATVFHGYVDDFSSIFNSARIAIVPEVIGGGFKLKILDYIFSGLPVAALTQASAGLPAEIRQTFLSSDSLRGLVLQIVEMMDQVDLLDQMQATAALAAQRLFDWSDRGTALRLAISDRLEHDK